MNNDALQRMDAAFFGKQSKMEKLTMNFAKNIWGGATGFPKITSGPGSLSPSPDLLSGEVFVNEIPTQTYAPLRISSTSIGFFGQ